MILQMVAFTYYLVISIIIVTFAVFYLNLSIYVALPLVVLVAPMVAIYMVHRCCEDL